ncbi:MAG: hypothetical protein Q9162_006119 [Coniocarpon cinnabarinum]
MNISRPVPSSIANVCFGTLSSEEVLALSVKRITNPQAIDPRLLHPNPSSLYDPALGAILEHVCTTCHLDTNACPGHPGHIELPIHVYHCQRLRLPNFESRRLLCKLKLIRHGLLKQAAELENVGAVGVRSGAHSADESDNGSDVGEDAPEISREMTKKESYTRKQIRRGIRHGDAFSPSTEAVTRARRDVVQEIMSTMGKTRKCPFCQAYTPAYRKDRALSIFQKPLSKKEFALNAQNAEVKLKKSKDFFQEMAEARQRNSKKATEEAMRREAALRGREMHPDEGVADMDNPASDDEIHVLESPIVNSDAQESVSEDGGEVERNAAEDTLSGRAMVESEPTLAKAKRVRETEDSEGRQERLPTEEVHARLQQLFEKHKELFSEIYCPPAVGSSARPPSVDMFFIKHLLIPPNKYRKESKTAPDAISEAADNAPYRRILTTCQTVEQIRQELANGTGDYSTLESVLLMLQGHVNALIDVTKGQSRPSLTDKGIKQKLEKKEGIMRMNVMGKRVNFAARSVISPDPNLEANEVGVPPVFAKKLTYPEPVTTHNFAELKQAVINGPSKWPGAVAVEFENGQVINLRRKNIVDRQAIANSLLAPSSALASGVRTKKVYRHLNNGDVVLMNRQPTLHKPSMMGHRARVLPGEKTIRMHYANTNSYNADFDGDEMNMHFPQNELARAEALQIADTDHQYLSTTSGSPLRGLIQDHISMGVWLSSQDTMFTREEYQELMYCSMRPENNQTNSDRIKTIDPTVWRPVPKWTGKDLITTVLENIQPEGYSPLGLRAPCLIAPARFGPKSEENTLRIKGNTMITGTLDKSQIGASSGGLVHAVYEAYGHVAAGKFISILGRLLTLLLGMRAFSCGIEDLIVTQDGESKRKMALDSSRLAGIPAASQYVSLENQRNAEDPELLERLETISRDDEKLKGLDTVMQQTGNEIDKQIAIATVPTFLLKSFPQNQMQTMTESKAKGSPTNAKRISANLGQQNLEGRRVPVMVSGKTLPSFSGFEPSLRAGGYITDRFLTGVRPQEYYFHSMSGREGLVDTAVKTSRSGYLQRCVIKGLEGCTAGHDGSVRDADGTLIQALYGEDGLEISQQAKIADFAFVTGNAFSYLAKLDIARNYKIFEASQSNKHDYNRRAEKIYQRTEDLLSIDPALGLYAPTRYLGSTSERYFSAAKGYIEQNPDKHIKESKNDDPKKVTKRAAQMIADFNYLKAIVPAGDAVGVVAGQSVGEPSTQMTLNTFHMAGSAQNVTLGIPRLREVLMAASKNIKTPMMVLHFLPGIEEIDRLKTTHGISKRPLAEFVDSVQVEEELGISDHFGHARMFDIKLSLYPKQEYKMEYSVQPDDVGWSLDTQLVSNLDKLVKQEFKRRGQAKSSKTVSDANPNIGKSSGRVRAEQSQADAEAEGGDSDVEDGGDDDATNAKRRQNVDEGVTYEDPDESDAEIERAGEREASPDFEDVDEGYGASPAVSRETSPNATSQVITPRKRRPAHESAIARAREQKLKDQYNHLTAFSFNDVDDGPADTCEISLEFPSNTSKIQMLQLVKRAIQATVVQEMSGIQAANFVKPKERGDAFFEEGSYITTEGVNVRAFWERNFPNIVDVDRLYTNSVHHMLEQYGVECGRECIIKELHSVFSGHGIDVNRRHLTLVADYMTRAGTYLPFNRIGMKDDESVFKKMSFETTVSFLRDCVIEGGREELRSPSARLMMGAVGRSGTGGFDVLLPLVESEEKEIKKEDENDEKEL